MKINKIDNINTLLQYLNNIDYNLCELTNIVIKFIIKIATIPSIDVNITTCIHPRNPEQLNIYYTLLGLVFILTNVLLSVP